MKFIIDITYEQLINNPKLLEDIINRDEASALKSVQIPNNVAYYNSDNTNITERKKYYWDYKYQDKCEDFSKANHKLAHGYHKEIVDQATNYLVGKRFDIVFSEDEISEEQVAFVESVMFKENELHISISEYLMEMQLKHYGWYYIFKDQVGRFRVEKMETENIIAIYDSSIDQNITSVIRKYKKMIYSENKQDFIEIMFVDVYNNKYVTTFAGTGKNGMLQTVEQKPLLSNKVVFANGDTEDTDIGEWHSVPFVPIEFDNYEKTQLDFYKDFIDMIDITLSDLANNIDDIQEVVWVLENYSGQNIDKFMDDLKDYKAIKVGAGGSVDALKNEIPTQARETLAKALQKAIYKFGQAVDLDLASISNVAQETLTLMFARLDLKADNFEIKLTEAIRKIFKFLMDYVIYVTGQEIDLSDIEVVFNRDFIVVESARIDNLVKSVGILSEETVLSKHPYVKDVQKELERIESEDEPLQFEDEEELLEVMDEDDEKTAGEGTQEGEQEAD